MPEHPLEILLLRHAKSSWKSPAQSDHERPLNDRGIRAAATMARLCARLNLLPDRILSSDACRTRETAERFIETSGLDVPIEFRPELYHAPPKTIVEAARSHGARSRRLLVIAHNPGIEELTSRLVGKATNCPTATLSRFRIDPEDWSDWTGEAGEHLGTWRPKEIED
ncbi:MAG: histidine phosphatase family protein [Phycisphaerales bacterium]|jgi:phosphohistidine phosphatase|nr:histidine phosphatase family protein [Phycisphaerales bacterium]